MFRRFVETGLLVCTGFTLALIFAPVANAMCVPPSIKLSAIKGQPGSVLTVTGQNFWLRCNDVVINGVKPVMEPARDIKILLKQGDQARLLTTVSTADAKLRFSVMVIIPVDAALGMASVVAEDDAHRLRPSSFIPSGPFYGRIPGDERPQPVKFEVFDGRRANQAGFNPARSASLQSPKVYW
jgi:hypothetical protein